MAKTQFRKQDEKNLVESIESEQFGREKRRSEEREKVWKELDRQIAEKPSTAHKQSTSGEEDKNRAWMPVMELPNQAAALEMTVADEQRLLFPKGAHWFQANASLTDEYLRRVDFQSLVAGDENEVPSQINQDNANQLVRGWHNHNHRQYSFRDRWSSFNTEATKYGTAVGKFKMVRHSWARTTSGGIVPKEKMIPEMIPRSVWNVYLDDSEHHSRMEGNFVGPSTHDVEWRSFEDLKRAALKGNQDPRNENGGWRPSALKTIEDAQKSTSKGEVKLITVEGDHLIPRKTTKPMLLVNMLATVAVSGDAASLVRLRINEQDEPTYFSHRYHVEDINDVYGVSPLLKAVPLQQAASAALVRLMAWAELNVLPPLNYDASDPAFAQSGGPVVYPMAQWGTMSEVKNVQIGDGGALLQLYLHLLKQYEDLTGVTAPRLGDKTVSHTTAFSKDVELSRGLVRNVDYINGVMDGPLVNWLQMEYRLARKFSGKQTFFIQDYGGFVDIESKHLPDLVSYEVFGGAGPAEEREMLVKKTNALQTATQIELLRRQLGDNREELDLLEIQKQTLREGFTDVDVFYARPDVGGNEGVVELQPALTSGSDPVTSLVETG